MTHRTNGVISSAYSALSNNLFLLFALEIMGHFGENYTLNDLSYRKLKKLLERSQYLDEMLKESATEMKKLPCSSVGFIT